MGSRFEGILDGACAWDEDEEVLAMCAWNEKEEHGREGRRLSSERRELEFLEGEKENLIPLNREERPDFSLNVRKSESLGLI